jgi:hypothetical protein
LVYNVNRHVGVDIAKKYKKPPFSASPQTIRLQELDKAIEVSELKMKMISGLLCVFGYLFILNAVVMVVYLS